MATNATNDSFDNSTPSTSPSIYVVVSLPGNDDDNDDTVFFHPHWSRYSDVIDTAPDWLMVGIGVYITIVCIAGIVGNAAVVSVFFRTSSLRTPSNYFIVNLAISDAAFSMIAGFPLMSISCFRRRWTWGQTGKFIKARLLTPSGYEMVAKAVACTACEYYAFFAALCGFNSIGTMALIAVDRYRFICRPLEMLYEATPIRAVVQVVGVWTWAVLCTLPPLIGWGRYIPEGFQVSCTFDYLTRTPANIAYNYALVVMGFVLPVVIIFACYVCIVRLVFRQATRVIKASTISVVAQRLAREKDAREQEWRLAKVLAIMVVLFVVSWLPYALIAQFGILGLSDLVTPYSAEIPVLLAKTSAVWNPVIYAMTGWSKIYQHHERRRRRYKTNGDSSLSSERRLHRNPREKSPIELNQLSPVSGIETIPEPSAPVTVEPSLNLVSD